MKMANQQDPKVTDVLQKASGAAMEAAKMGKAAAMIAKGAAAGGPGGAAIAALKNPRATLKLGCIAGFVMILPVLLIVMLPLIIFNAIVGFVGGILSSIGAFFRSLPVIGAIIIGIGSLFGGGAADYAPGDPLHFDNAFDTAHIVYNLEQAHEIIGDAHFLQYQEVIALINDAILELPEGDEGRVIGIDGDAFQFNTSVILGMYAASLYDDVMQISLDDLRDAMNRADRTGDLFGYLVEVEVESRMVYPGPDDYDEVYGLPPPFEIEVTIHNFIVIYNGEMVFAEIFGIADDERLMAFAHEYARNLMTLLTDTEMGAWFGIILEAGIVPGFYSPFPGMDWRISSPFGYRNHPVLGVWRMHNGIDIPKPTGTPIRAIADGYVILAQFSSSAGIWIQIDHGYIPGIGNVISEYMHNSRNLVSVTNPRTRVSAGQVIAEVGSTGISTGPHLHLGIRVNSAHVNPTSFIGAPP
jgi:hypothetical protein